MSNRFNRLVENGIAEDAANFLCEWYPEVEYKLDAKAHGYIFEVMTEEELAEHLYMLDCTEEEYEYEYGTIFRDAAFDGVIVIGE